MDNKRVAVIVGAGTGLGCALAERFARASMHVAMGCRHPEKLQSMAAGYSGIAHAVEAWRCDAGSEDSVQTFFHQVEAEMGQPDVVIYNAGAYVRGSIVDTSLEDFERCWRIGCLGGFLVGREAARRMLARLERGGAGGTILFTGATASLRGSAGFHNLAVGKAGLRALAQSMARELQPRGIHVGHVVIDGRIRAPQDSSEGSAPDDRLEPAAIAEAYFQLYCQPRSAWTLELDLRPWVERF